MKTKNQIVTTPMRAAAMLGSFHHERRNCLPEAAGSQAPPGTPCSDSKGDRNLLTVIQVKPFFQHASLISDKSHNFFFIVVKSHCHHNTSGNKGCRNVLLQSKQ